METMKNNPLAGLVALMAAAMGPQAKVDLATRHWVDRFKEAVIERRPSIVDEAAPDPEIMQELAETHLDPIKAAREYLLRVFNQPRAADDTFDLDPFGDKEKMSRKDQATVKAMSILWDNDFLFSLNENAPALGDKLMSDFDWDYIDTLHKQGMSPKEAAACYVVKLHPELAVKQ